MTGCIHVYIYPECNENNIWHIHRDNASLMQCTKCQTQRLSWFIIQFNFTKQVLLQ